MPKEMNWETNELCNWLMNSEPWYNDMARIVDRAGIVETVPRNNDADAEQVEYDLDQIATKLEEWAEGERAVEQAGIYDNNPNPDDIDWDQLAKFFAEEQAEVLGYTIKADD